VCSSDLSELIQMLKKGHHGVKLDTEAWDRLITWIDLNVPDHGTWSEHRQIASNFRERRQQFNAKYANRTDDPEIYPDVKHESAQFVEPVREPERKNSEIKISGWPFDAAEAKERQNAVGLPARQKIELAQGIALDLSLIPAGQFVMGDANGCADEWPASAVTIAKPFYIGVFEITNEQFAQFDPAHDSAYISVFNKDQNTRGEPVNRPKQPVLRVSWSRAMAFCEWLTKKTGRKFTLPTEAQWEWACRAGTASSLNFGDLATDFGKLANLADKRVADLCKRDSPKWIPHIETVNDGAAVTNDVGRYAPNAWGLHDMHGNVAEWTLTTWKPYPYNTADGRDAGADNDRKVVRGGLFYDRPERARSGFRLSFPSWQRVYNVGFRAVCEAPADVKAVAQMTNAR
jgi:formylglycine-generating enzyme required for sulfatase activity